MLTLATLKNRGWTSGMIEKLLGEPDDFKRNPRFAKAAEMRLYSFARVEAVSMSCDFAAAKARAARRSTAATKAADTKRLDLMKRIATLEVVVTKLPPAEIRNRAIEAFNTRSRSGDLVYQDATGEFLERITVNFIRHNLTRYDDTLNEVAGRVGVVNAVREIRVRVFEAIATAYPDLKSECERQLHKRGLPLPTTGPMQPQEMIPGQQPPPLKIIAGGGRTWPSR